MICSPPQLMWDITINPKRTISASGGSEPLQMVSEPDTGRCVSLLAVPRRGVDTRWCASKDAEPQTGVDLGVVPHRLEEGKNACEDVGPRRGWIVMSHIGWGGEQITLYKGVETFP